MARQTTAAVLAAWDAEALAGERLIAAREAEEATRACAEDGVWDEEGRALLRAASRERGSARAAYTKARNATRRAEARAPRA